MNEDKNVSNLEGENKSNKLKIYENIKIDNNQSGINNPILKIQNQPNPPIKLNVIEKNNNISNIPSKNQEKNIDLKSTSVENDKNKLLQEKDNKIEKLNKAINILNSKIETLNKKGNESENIIKELNFAIIEYKQKIASNEKKNIFLNKIKTYQEDNNIEKITMEYETEMNNLRNNNDQWEIKNQKLIFENKILNEKLKTFSIEKENEIKNINNIHQNKIKTYEDNISALNDEIEKLKKKCLENENALKNAKLKEISELNQKAQLKLIEGEKNNLVQENKKIKTENEEMKKNLEEKEKTIEKLQTEIENMDYCSNRESKQQNLNQSAMVRGNCLNIEELINEIEFLKNENIELKSGFTRMTSAIDEANQLYNEKLLEFNNQILLKNNKLREYKNKISILKFKINELYLKQLNPNTNNSIIPNMSDISFCNLDQSFNTNKINRNSNLSCNTKNVLKQKTYNQPNYLTPMRIINKNINIGNNNQICGNLLSPRVSGNTIEMFPRTDNRIKDNIEFQQYRNHTEGTIKNEKIENINSTKSVREMQEFINKNKEVGKKEIDYIKEFKKTLSKIENKLNKVK